MSGYTANYILYADGSQAGFDGTTKRARELIGATVMDGFSLRDGRYVYVDDLGHQKMLPVNKKATELYHSICKPGTTFEIRGNVAVVWEGNPL